MKKRALEAAVIVVVLAVIFAVTNGILGMTGENNEEKITIDGVDYALDTKKLSLLLTKGEGFSEVSRLSELEELVIIPYVTKASEDAKRENADLYKTYTRVEDISCIKGLTSLKKLYIGGCGVTDIGVLSGMNNMQILDISGTEVKDISVINEMTALTELYIGGCKIADYEPIYACGSLQTLHVDKGQTEALDVARLEKVRITTDETAEESLENGLNAIPTSFVRN